MRLELRKSADKSVEATLKPLTLNPMFKPGSGCQAMSDTKFMQPSHALNSCMGVQGLGFYTTGRDTCPPAMLEYPPGAHLPLVGRLQYINATQHPILLVVGGDASKNETKVKRLPEICLVTVSRIFTDLHFITTIARTINTIITAILVDFNHICQSCMHSKYHLIV